jgi:hypothetical protein
VHIASACMPLFGIPSLGHGAKAGRRAAPQLESFTRPIAMSHQIHTYTELRQQIHDDLRIKYPEWVVPNGESSMCIMEVLDTLTRRGNQKRSVFRTICRTALR